MTESDWPSYLRGVMRAKNIATQSEFARKAGLDRSVVSQWLSDQAQPTIPKLEKVRDAFGIPLVELMVAAGLISKEDGRMKERPKPPEPVTLDEVEQEIRGAGLPPEIEKALLKVREDNRAQIRAQLDALRASGVINGSSPNVNSA